jgi:methyl-accepting chemotaxis protein
VLGIFSLALWCAVTLAWSGARSAAQAATALIDLSERRIQPLHDTERLFLVTLLNMDNAYINLLKGDEVKSNDYTRRASAALQEAKKTFDAYRRAPAPQPMADADAPRVAQAYEAYARVLGQREVALYDVSLDDYAAATASAEAADRAFAAILREVIGHAEAVHGELRLASERRYAVASWLAAAMLACSLLLVGLYWMLFDRVLLRPLKEAGRHFERIAGGDLGTPVRGISGNEIGTLLAALARMQHGLAGTVARIRDATGDVHRGAREIARGNGELAQRTEQQAAALEETAATLEQLSSAVRNNAENAGRTNELAAAAARDAERGGQVMGGIAGAMAQVTASAARISDIAGVIDGIAFQTNILALNASVEAARAGAQGRGFAVVAAEVRSLALRSAQAAREVKGLISDSIDSVGQASDQVAQADRAIGQIVGSFSQVMKTVNEIATATREQAEGIGQVSRTLVEMDRSTQQNAALVEQTSAAAAALTTQAGALAASVAVFSAPAPVPGDTTRMAAAAALPSQTAALLPH